MSVSDQSAPDGELQALRSENRELSRLLDKLENREGELRRRNTELCAQLEHFKATLARSVEEGRGESDGLEGRLRERDERIAELERRNGDLQTLLERTSDELTGEKKHVQQLGGSLHCTTKRLKEAQGELADARAALATLNARLTGLTHENERLEAFVRSVRASRLTAKGDALSLSELLQSLGNQGTTGVLSIESEDSKVDLFLSQGALVFLNPRRVVLAPGESGISCSGLSIPRTYVERFLTGLTRNEDSVFFQLLEDGHLGHEDVRTLMVSLGVDLICRSLLAPHDCMKQLFRKEAIPAKFTDLGYRSPISRFVLRVYSTLDEYASLRAELSGCRVCRDEEAAAEDTGSLDERARQILENVTGERTADELARACSLTEFEVYRGIRELAKRGFVKVESPRLSPFGHVSESGVAWSAATP